MTIEPNSKPRRGRPPKPDTDTIEALADDVAIEALRLARGKLLGFIEEEE
ncbi:MAG: hypothetical protein PVI23_07030 [Maricaulaceae bacterium]|jgi:hypothetical protein